MSGAQAAFLRPARDGARAPPVTVLAGPAPGAKPPVRPRPPTLGPLGSGGLDSIGGEVGEGAMWDERPRRHAIGDVDVFVDVASPPPRLIVFGAVDVAAALCR